MYSKGCHITINCVVLDNEKKCLDGRDKQAIHLQIILVKLIIVMQTEKNPKNNTKLVLPLS